MTVEELIEELARYDPDTTVAMYETFDKFTEVTAVWLASVPEKATKENDEFEVRKRFVLLG
jgi:hypothetical protein